MVTQSEVFAVQFYSMLPGMSAQMMPEGESESKIKRYMTVMDSMTNEGENYVLFQLQKKKKKNYVLFGV